MARTRSFRLSDDLADERRAGHECGEPPFDSKLQRLEPQEPERISAVAPRLAALGFVKPTVKLGQTVEIATKTHRKGPPD
ncbi:MAG: hypothetical protein ACOY4C_12375 [Pseudomonadota bacterium]